MTTFSSQDFQQVYGSFPSTGVNSSNTAWITSATLGDPNNEKVSANLTLGSITYGPLPNSVWPNTLPNTVPYEPVVVLSPEQKAHLNQQREKLLGIQKKDGTAVKNDAGKTNWSLMPWEALAEINAVLEFGANKYAAHNWQRGDGFRYTRVLNSLLRHVFAYMRGEDTDPESGLSHMAHAGCNVLFLLHYHKNKTRYKNDDRYVP